MTVSINPSISGNSDPQSLAPAASAVYGSDGYVPARRTVYSDTITEWLRNRYAHVLLARPAKTAPYRCTNTIYIDPTSPTNGAGTLGDPKNTFSGITPAADTAYLFKRGTTHTGAISLTITATATTPVILGVYDATSGQPSLEEVGGATIDANSAATTGITLSGAYIGCYGLRVINPSASSGAGIKISGGSSYIHVKSCNTTSWNGIGIWSNTGTTLDNITIEGNVCDSTTTSGIVIDGAGSHTNYKVHFNKCRSNALSGIYFGPYNGTATATTMTVAYNVCTSNTAMGIRWLISSTDVSMFGNMCQANGTYGIAFSGTSGNLVHTRTVVQNNDCNANGEFGIWTNARGSWTIELNRCWRNGSLDGGTSAGSANKYGRGIELVGVAFSSGATGGTVRWNSCCEQYNFGGGSSNGTEGVGIGADKYCSHIDIYGNYCARNEGNGIQPYLTNAVRIFCNLVVDNFKIASNLRGMTVTADKKANIFLGSAGQSNLDVFNNTIVCGQTPTQLYGISEPDASTNRAQLVRNNLIIGATTAGINLYASATTESYNGFQACSMAVRNATSGAAVSSATAVVGSFGAERPYYWPLNTSNAAAGGTDVDAAAESLRGDPLGATPPIGAWTAV
jgi:hypothetical protein